jgi:chromosome segregation ATPase
MVMHPASSDSAATRRLRRLAVSLLGALTLGAVSVLATSVPPAAQQPQPNAPKQPAAAGDAANARAAQIAAQRQVIATLTEKLQALRTQLKELMAQEPRNPGPNATDEQKKKYNSAHAQWQQSVDKVNGSITNVMAQLDAAKKKLAVLEAGQ